MAELVDALDLGSSVLGRVGSTPSGRTIHQALFLGGTQQFALLGLAVKLKTACSVSILHPFGEKPPARIQHAIHPDS